MMMLGDLRDAKSIQNSKYDHLQVLLFYKVFPCQNLKCGEVSDPLVSSLQDCWGFHCESEKRRFPFYEHMSKFKDRSLISKLKTERYFTIVDYFKNVNGFDEANHSCPLHFKYLDSLTASTSHNKVCLTQLELNYHPLVFKRNPCQNIGKCRLSICPYFHSGSEQWEFSQVHQFLQDNAFYPRQSIQKNFEQKKQQGVLREKHLHQSKLIDMLDWDSNLSSSSIISGSAQSNDKPNVSTVDNYFRDLKKRSSIGIHPCDDWIANNSYKRISTQAPLRLHTTSNAQMKNSNLSGFQFFPYKLNVKPTAGSNWSLGLKSHKPRTSQIVFDHENINSSNANELKPLQTSINSIDLNSKPSLELTVNNLTQLSDSELRCSIDNKPIECNLNLLKRTMNRSTSSPDSHVPENPSNSVLRNASISKTLSSNKLHFDLQKIRGKKCKRRKIADDRFIQNRQIDLAAFRKPLQKLNSLDTNELGRWINGLLNASGGTLLIGISDEDIVTGVEMDRAKIDAFQINLDNKLRQFRPTCFPGNVLLNFHEVCVDDQCKLEILHSYIIQIDVFSNILSCIYTDGNQVFYAEKGNLECLNTSDIVNLAQKKLECEHFSVLDSLLLNPLSFNRMSKKELEITIVNIENLLRIIKSIKTKTENEQSIDK